MSNIGTVQGTFSAILEKLDIIISNKDILNMEQQLIEVENEYLEATELYEKQGIYRTTPVFACTNVIFSAKLGYAYGILLNDQKKSRTSKKQLNE